MEAKNKTKITLKNKVLQYNKFRYVDSNGKIHWHLWVKLVSEAVGMFGLVFWIALPNVLSFGNYQNPNHWAYGNQGLQSWSHGMAQFFAFPFMGPLYVGIGIFLLLIGMIHISANFNPAVTIMEVKRGEDTYTTAFYKILTQFTFAFLSGYAMLEFSKAIGTWDIGTVTSNGIKYAVNLDAVSPVLVTPTFQGANIANAQGFMSVKTTFYSVGQSWFWYISLFVEMILMASLLGLVFLGKMSKNARVLFVSIGIIFIVFLGSFTENFSLNPARTMAPAIMNDLGRQGMNASNSSLMSQWIWIYLVGQILGVFLFGALDEKHKLGDKFNWDKNNKHLSDKKRAKKIKSSAK